MTFNYNELSSLISTFDELSTQKMPFKLSLIIAKNLSVLKKEEEFYIEQERGFAQKYLQFDEEKQEFVQHAPGVFSIKEGLEEECRSARAELDAFTVEMDLKTIPMSLIENLEFTPNQLVALEKLIEEE